MTTTLEFPVSDIRTDSGTQVRAGIRYPVVVAYAERMRANDTLPDVTIFDDGTVFHLADGFHRVQAAKLIGRTTIGAEVHLGSREDALWFALGANRANGLQLTELDKQHAVELALKQWPERMQREIADQVGCSPSLVSKVALKMTPAPSAQDAANTTSGESGIRGRALAIQQKREAIRAMVTAGATSTEIKRQLHAHTTIIAEVKREMGVSTIDYSRKGINQRKENIRRMAAEGYHSSQIASVVGVREETVRETLRREKITALADTVTRGMHRHDANRIVGRIVMDAENLLAGATLIDFADLDRGQIADWVRSLQQSRGALRLLIKRLQQELEHGEAA